ncbi:hypothetical protein B0H14DRAFT_2564847 [Mycena olivaceomarginata]|nr:hypothetical protein B0H14DRAFT_2564847 [Mycena olivaceomarginata]
MVNHGHPWSSMVIHGSAMINHGCPNGTTTSDLTVVVQKNLTPQPGNLPFCTSVLNLIFCNDKKGHIVGTPGPYIELRHDDSALCQTSLAPAELLDVWYTVSVEVAVDTREAVGPGVQARATKGGCAGGEGDLRGGRGGFTVRVRGRACIEFREHEGVCVVQSEGLSWVRRRRRHVRPGPTRG